MIRLLTSTQRFSTPLENFSRDPTLRIVRLRHKWDWKAASAPESAWVCTHCRHVCPDRAQCAIYRRTNERRREQQQQQRARVELRRRFELEKARSTSTALDLRNEHYNAQPLEPQQGSYDPYRAQDALDKYYSTANVVDRERC